MAAGTTCSARRRWPRQSPRTATGRRGHVKGTIKVFGTPAEEILFGKTFMLRDGAFKGTDVALAWHPDDENQIHNRSRIAVLAADVEFFGKTAHAAASPWLGRSSLDALVLFDHAMALLREHIKPTARIHRVIKEGGKVANVIPDYAKGQYWLRDATIESVNEMLERLKKAADGAALGTETRAKVTVLASTREPIPNDVLGKLIQQELERVGPPQFDDKDQQFAKALQRELGAPEAGLATSIIPYGPGHGGTASSDIGEVSAVDAARRAARRHAVPSVRRPTSGRRRAAPRIRSDTRG